MNSLELAAALKALPPSFRTDHPLLDIQTACRLGFMNPLWNKREAARLAFRANMEAAVARGKGYAATRRVMEIGERIAASLEALHERMKQEQRRIIADRMSEFAPEGRLVAHHHRINFKE